MNDLITLIMHSPLKKMVTRNTLQLKIRKMLTFLGHMRKESLENFTLTGHIERSKDKKETVCALLLQ